MNKELDQQVASSLDAPPALLPFLGELLADVEALGSSPPAVVDLLRSLNIPHARMLDLGCGKGAVALAVARQLGWNAHGVDAFPPFIHHARQSAIRNGLASLCEFTCDDLRNVACAGKRYDVVVYAGHTPLIDAMPCVNLLRKCVPSGGYMLIDDGFLRENVDSAPDGYETYLPHAETINRLTARGDRLVREVISSAEERNNREQKTTALIRARAEVLAARHVESAGAMFDYVHNQEKECQTLLNVHAPAAWILQRQ